jgi:hypothetical protein
MSMGKMVKIEHFLGFMSMGKCRKWTFFWDLLAWEIDFPGFLGFAWDFGPFFRKKHGISGISHFSGISSMGNWKISHARNSRKSTFFWDL